MTSFKKKLKVPKFSPEVLQSHQEVKGILSNYCGKPVSFLTSLIVQEMIIPTNTAQK